MMNLISYIYWDPNLLVFGLVRWYSLCWLIGLLLAYLIVKNLYKQQGIKAELFEPLFLYCFVGILAGARLGHCLFYQPDYYLSSLKHVTEMIIPIHFLPDGGWKFTGYEGLASHGGAIALVLCMIWFARRYGRDNGFDFAWIMDHLAIATSFAACLIRLGNLFNSEIYGVATNLPWGFVFLRDNETAPKHPTQIYEALSYLLLGICLIWIYRKWLYKTYRGLYIGIFLIWCFGSRFLIEFIKNPQVAFEEGMKLDMGQLLSIPFILFGIGFIIYSFVKKDQAWAASPSKPVTKKPEVHAHSTTN